MEILAFNNASLAQAVHILQQGGVVAHATETCYGLACDLSNASAVEKLFLIKQRAFDKPVSGLFPATDEAKRYVEWSDEAQRLAIEYLPGPLTIVLPMRNDAPKALYPTPLLPGGQGMEEKVTLGIRVSSHPHAQALVAAFESPISTTSANLAGHANPYSAQEIQTQFRHADLKPDLILDSGDLPATPPSTVVDLSGSATVERRSGALRI